MKAENIELNHKFEVSKFLQNCISRGQASATQGMTDYGFERLHNELSELINQRVIEELENLELKFENYLNNKGDRPHEVGTKGFSYAWELANDYSKNRIKELKQE